MQILPETDFAGLLDRLVEDEVPDRRGFEAWRSLLRAHATLMRRLDTDLERETGLALADFDVLAQLAAAHGELRMTELAGRALISRSGLSRQELRALCDSLHWGITFQPGEHAVHVEVTLAADEPPDPDNRVRRSGPCPRGESDQTSARWFGSDSG